MDEKRKDLNKKIYKLKEICDCLDSVLVNAGKSLDELCEDEEDCYLANSFRPLAEGVRHVLKRRIYKLNEKSKDQELNADMKKALDEYGKVLSTGCKPNASSIALFYGVDFEDFALSLRTLMN